MFNLLSVFLIFLTGIAGGLFSARLADTEKSEMFFSIGNAFAGGVFLGAGLLHMLPDASKGLGNLTGSTDFPWIFLLCALGFLLVLLIEKVLSKGHEALESVDYKMGGTGINPYIIVLVLSVHSVIAGIALGAEEHVTRALVILFAILAHKGSASFAIGINLARKGFMKGQLIKVTTFFSVMTPIGVLIGAGFSKFLTGGGEEVFEGVFDALAAGTFLYVALLDVVHEEFRLRKNLLMKFIFLVSGLTLMAVLAVWT